MFSISRAALLPLPLLLLGGCATLSADGGFDPVRQSAKDRLKVEARWARNDGERAAIDQRVAQLLAQPLSADAAVEIAVLNNRGLQASFADLGIAEADLVQASRLPNPGFSFARIRQGSALEIDRGIQFNLMSLLTMPLAQRIESQRLQQTRLQVTSKMLSLATETRKAFYLAVAAEESARYLAQVSEAADAGADLARRQTEAGNWSKLLQAREQSFHADANLNVLRSEQLRAATRERLVRLMGLAGPQATIALPERLPDLPQDARQMADIEQAAIDQRFDVQAARLDTEQTARQLGLTRATRFVNVLEVGALRNTHSDAPTEHGYEVRLELPLFDWGDARVARAEAIYGQSVDRAIETAINARSEARTAYSTYRASHDVARRYRDEILPLKKRISEENLLRYNGMLIGVFELLADARSQIESARGYIDALRDFWLAEADLEQVLVGPAMTNDR